MIDESLSEVYKVGAATCNITPCTEKGLESENIKWVTDIQVPIDKRKQGLAKQLLIQLGKDSDATQTALMLECRPLDDTITVNDLESMYKRHGFIRVQDEPLLMLRVPVPPMLFADIAKKKTSSIITNVYGIK